MSDSKLVKDNFNPRSREGSDGKRLKLIQQMNISIHAPAKGATKTRQRDRRDY